MPSRRTWELKFEKSIQYLELENPDWSKTYIAEKRSWLYALFSKSLTPGLMNQRVYRVLGFAFLLLMIVLFPAFLLGLLNRTLPNLHDWRWVTGAFATWVLTAVASALLLGALASIKYFRRVPWGDIFSFGRSFEAISISDIFLYGSDRPKERIQRKTVEALEPHLLWMQESSPGEKLQVILVGHSLGSVVTYDMLRHASDAERNESSSFRRELASLESLDQNSLKAELGEEYDSHAAALDERAKFLRRMLRMVQGIEILGMHTFGSPIALFMFRKPELLTAESLKGRTNWKGLLPLAFQQEGTHVTYALRWVWKNYWHPADFVAHRVEELFLGSEQQAEGAGSPPGWTMVEDVSVNAPVAHPIAAHSCYWSHSKVIAGIADHVAQCLKAVSPPH
jgi:hypothetical protein